MMTMKDKPAPAAGGSKAQARDLATRIAAGDEAAKDVCRNIYKQFGLNGLIELDKTGLRGGRLVEASATMTLPALIAHREPAPPAAAAAPEPAVAEAASEEAKRLMDECGAVKIRWSWFRTSKKVEDQDKSKMAEAADTTAKGFSAGKRLMGSDHPTVKEANELRNRIASYVRGVSLPVTQLGEADAAKKEGGVYLVRKADMERFEERMTAFQAELKTMEAKVNAELPGIKNADRARLGNLYREQDYPATVRLTVGYFPVNLEPPPYLEKFAPKMFERERKKAEKWWQGVYDAAAMEFVEEFKAVIASWVEALGPITRLYPDAGHKLHRLSGAEVRQQLTSADNPDIPHGKTSLVVRYKDPRSNGRKSVEETLPPMSNAEVADLKPHKHTDKAKTFKNTTVENLLDMIGKFRTLGSTLSASKDFTALVDEIEREVKKGGERVSEVGDELRTSRAFRSNVHELMRRAGDRIEVEVHSLKKRRRRVDVTVAGSEDDESATTTTTE